MVLDANVSGVREAEPRDAMACAGVHVRSWKVTYRGMVPDAYLDTLETEDRVPAWEDWLSEPKTRGCILVIEAQGRIEGFGSFVGHARLGPDWSFVPNIYLEPAAIGRGHGRELMRCGLERLVGFGYDQAELWVHPENRRARRFYEVGGWVTDGTARTESVWGVDVPELRYTRRLNVEEPS